MQKNYLGIDVSKLSFDLALITVKKGIKESVLTTEFDNNATGLKAFKAYLVKQAAVFIQGTTPARTRRYQIGINKFWT